MGSGSSKNLGRAAHRPVEKFSGPHKRNIIAGQVCLLQKQDWIPPLCPLLQTVPGKAAVLGPAGAGAPAEGATQSFKGRWMAWQGP